MRIFHSFISLLLLTSCSSTQEKELQESSTDQNYTVIAVPGFKDNRISSRWKEALKTRMSKQELDSVSNLNRPLTEEELGWKALIESRVSSWNLLKDSLKVPFGDIYINDTTYVLLGFTGFNDGFTFKYQTVCLDLTAMYSAYGSASEPVNKNRIDRIFAHEYTHLLHKEWARQKELIVPTYKDSILWECIYEGIGMYRSMSTRWFPIGDSLSETAKNTFQTLYPKFVERLIIIDTSKNLAPEDKKNLNSNLSQGSMTSKWGALPVGVWLAMEADGDDRKLIPWIEKGPDAIIPLAMEHLDVENRKIFENHFQQQ